MLKKWDDLPYYMKNNTVKEYYDKLKNKQISIIIKRLFDILLSLLTIIVLSPLFFILSILIKIDSKGSIFFKQVRVSRYGKHFKILKFRTMVNNAERIGTQVTTFNDNRITKIGKVLRKYRLDEIPQLFNIITGDMSFVGTRPEVVKYVNQYTDEMMATLLLPAGVTSKASIEYKEEGKILSDVDNADDIYINMILPVKMKYNLQYIETFRFLSDISIIFKTVLAVMKKDKNIVEINNVKGNQVYHY